MTEVTIKHAVKKHYVYRVEVVRWPVGHDLPEFRPEGWPTGRNFRWPRSRLFLSLHGAERLAAAYSGFGCDVEIRRARVTFSGASVVREIKAGAYGMRQPW